MYQLRLVTDKNQVIAEATAKAPFGPAFTQEEAEQAHSLEVMASSFDDRGPDFCEFRLLGENKEILKTKRLGGY